jgi:hypothetical protein
MRKTKIGFTVLVAALILAIGFVYFKIHQFERQRLNELKESGAIEYAKKSLRKKFPNHKNSKISFCGDCANRYYGSIEDNNRSYRFTMIIHGKDAVEFVDVSVERFNDGFDMGYTNILFTVEK